MQIVCPSCRAEAQVPSSKEGARVRCGACGRVYTAEPRRAPGKRRRRRGGLSLAIFGGAAALGLVLFFAVRRQEPAVLSGPTQVAPEPTATAPVDLTGWASPPVLAGRALFEAAAAGDAARLEALRAPDAPALAPEQGGERLADWKPFDGEVLSEGDAEAAVRLSAGGTSPETASETRLFEVQLVRDGGAWKVAGWKRWLSLDEQKRAAELERAAAARAARSSEPVIETRKMTDGTVVYEFEPRPVPFPESTPQELRERITASAARLTDFSLRPTENTAAKQELVAIGAPALPALLTALYELPLVTDVDAMRVNLVNQCLEEITGTSMGFSPQIQNGSGVGTTEDLRRSSIRRWFAWWEREGATFEGPPAAVDLLDGLLAPAPASKAPPRR